MHREKYPETIPFRLTRMLVNAMEVSKIEGSYRSTCERTMSVLRDNRDSLVAMLEAFVYDPLISWRLLGQAAVEFEDDASTKRLLDAHAIANSDEVNSGKWDKREIFAKKLIPDPITEEQKEDDEGDDFQVGQCVETKQLALAHRSLGGSTPRSHHALSQNKSMQMYSDIQSMAANLGTSSRIASIARGASDRVTIEGSLGRSRLDRSMRQREVMSLLGEDGNVNEEALNEKALRVIKRVQDKLTGTDFGNVSSPEEPLQVSDQVQRLIVQATSTENLCQLFIGW
jgi:phosphatidylinositol kinase/protein kinase (PI-3  family)